MHTTYSCSQKPRLIMKKNMISLDGFRKDEKYLHKKHSICLFEISSIHFQEQNVKDLRTNFTFVVLLYSQFFLEMEIHRYVHKYNCLIPLFSRLRFFYSPFDVYLISQPSQNMETCPSYFPLSNSSIEFVPAGRKIYTSKIK